MKKLIFALLVFVANISFGQENFWLQHFSAYSIKTVTLKSDFASFKIKTKKQKKSNRLTIRLEDHTKIQVSVNGKVTGDVINGENEQTAMISFIASVTGGIKKSETDMQYDAAYLSKEIFKILNTSEQNRRSNLFFWERAVNAQKRSQIETKEQSL